LTIEFSHHALEKARWRKVKIRHIRLALKNPDRLYEDVEHGAMIAIKKVNKKSIVVAYREEDNLVKVITLYYTTKLDKLVNVKTVRGAWKKTK
jgi:hypothetical protein